MKLTKEGIAVIEGDTYLSQWIIDQGRLNVAQEEYGEKYTEGWEDLGAWDSLAVRRKP